jgi:hypothetical protein
VQYPIMVYTLYIKYESNWNILELFMEFPRLSHAVHLIKIFSQRKFFIFQAIALKICIRACTII